MSERKQISLKYKTRFFSDIMTDHYGIWCRSQQFRMISIPDNFPNLDLELDNDMLLKFKPITKTIESKRCGNDTYSHSTFTNPKWREITINDCLLHIKEQIEIELDEELDIKWIYDDSDYNE